MGRTEASRMARMGEALVEIRSSSDKVRPPDDERHLRELVRLREYSDLGFLKNNQTWRGNRRKARGRLICAVRPQRMHRRWRPWTNLGLVPSRRQTNTI